MCTKYSELIFSAQDGHEQGNRRNMLPRERQSKNTFPRLTSQPDTSFSKQQKGSQTTMERKMTERNFKFVP